MTHSHWFLLPTSYINISQCMDVIAWTMTSGQRSRSNAIFQIGPVCDWLIKSATIRLGRFGSVEWLEVANVAIEQSNWSLNPPILGTHSSSRACTTAPLADHPFLIIKDDIPVFEDCLPCLVLSCTDRSIGSASIFVRATEPTKSYLEAENAIWGGPCQHDFG